MTYKKITRHTVVKRSRSSSCHHLCTSSVSRELPIATLIFEMNGGTAGYCICYHLSSDYEVSLVSLSPGAHLHVVGILQFMFLTYTNRACPLLFNLFLCLFLSLWPFHLYFIPQILPTSLRFLTLFSQSYLCLIGPFNYISLYESLL